jgi:polyisoprenoid-binding protein YceI
MSTTTVSPGLISAGTYSVDPAHSNIGFEVRHMGIATVRGTFHKFHGTLEVSPQSTVFEGVVDVSSIDTGDEQRDAHLTAPDFFDGERYPEIGFRSTTADATDDGKLRLSGELTIRGITKPIELTGAVGAGGTDPWGNERSGFEVEGVIDRRDFDLKWNQTLPNGGLLVSNEVKLVVSVSAVKTA